ncbi:MAG: N4-gp56 family major capsid protein [Cetobacterium sp.]
MPNALSTNLVTSLSPSPDATQTFYHRELLDRAKYAENYGRWASNVPLPSKSGKNVIMRRYAHLAMALSPLAEGVAPAGKVPTLEDYQATIRQFGDFIALSDYADMTGIDDYQRHWAGLLGDQAGYTMDAVDRDVVTAGTSVIYSNGAARTSVLSIIDENDLDRAIRQLTNNGAMKILDGVSGNLDKGKSPTMSAYPAVTLPDVLFDLQNLEGFKWAYENSGGVEGEIGRYKQLAFFESADPSALGAGGKKFAGGGAGSTSVKNTAGTTDVYTIMIFGKNGFTRVPLNAGSTKVIRKGLGTAGTADPLDQLQTMGWKNSSARLITNQNWLVRVECAASL